MGKQLAVAPLPTPDRRVSSASPPPEPSIAIATRRGDPILDVIARSVFALFPHCVKCGRRIERFEDADVRILKYRVVHRDGCPPAERDGPP